MSLIARHGQSLHVRLQALEQHVAFCRAQPCQHERVRGER